MGKIKLLADNFMLVLSSKVKYWRFIGVIFAITLAALAIGGAYLLLKTAKDRRAIPRGGPNYDAIVRIAEDLHPIFTELDETGNEREARRAYKELIGNPARTYMVSEETKKSMQAGKNGNSHINQHPVIG